ncbi:MAG: PPC domain-containing protein [Phycisphaerales bacterium]
MYSELVHLRPRAGAVLAAVLLAGSIGGRADAGLAFEKERKFEATNETRDRAEFLASDLFTTNTDPNVFGDLPTVIVAGRGGGLDVDFYAFEMLEPGVMMVDIDGTPASFDAFLSIFDDRGALIAWSDNDANDRGSDQNEDDPFVGTLYLPEAGVYFIAVSSAANRPLILRQQAASADEAPIQSVAPRTVPLVRPDGGPGGFAVVGGPSDSDAFGETGALDALPYTLAVSASGVDAPPSAGISDLLSSAFTNASFDFPSAGFSGPIAVGGGNGGGGGDDGGGGGDDGDDDGGGDDDDNNPPPPPPPPNPIPLPGGGMLGLIGLGAMATRRRRPLD